MGVVHGVFYCLSLPFFLTGAMNWFTTDSHTVGISIHNEDIWKYGSGRVHNGCRHSGAMRKGIVTRDVEFHDAVAVSTVPHQKEQCTKRSRITFAFSRNCDQDLRLKPNERASENQARLVDITPRQRDGREPLLVTCLRELSSRRHGYTNVFQRRIYEQVSA
jgi:hypothetical protein